ncbi:MAG: FtsH protease activity modulator HflK [Methylovulum sp.]|uniref:FtsH protease activity modulator HflK n=1 Tax=Methylovulum sp. TaxID=1916980 RepID=UPI00260521FA|nr:FtsH protease activity modulator HflK [Methylovulum sp.]MDD2723461.1 FtsH protease activity modulator HflK [Methylovulum sp.]MDD5123921.1 FtsH protease activity modulator HflK [Methylovulum sp.]
MSWNEPGGDKKDPWSGRGDQNGPPDLDEAIRALQEKLGKIFGGGGGDGGDRSSADSGRPMKNLGFIVAGAAVFLWGVSGFYVVDEGNHGVETRFGKYIGITQSGLHWHIPAPIEQVNIVNVKEQRFIEVGYRSMGGEQMAGSIPKVEEALMLTKDENYVDVRLAVQYQVKDAKDFIFNIVNPAATLKQVTESAQRGVIGGSTMDFVLTEGRSEIVTQIKKEIQDVMDSYKSGVQITSVNLQDAQPPEQVQNAFADAIKAREDEQRLINEAEAYSNDVVPKARGAAARKMQEAEGYKEQVIAQAEGETSRFSKLYAEYSKAPDITRKRLYIESMEAVFSETNTVMIDVKGGNNMVYLPLDKMMQHKAPNQATQNNPVQTSNEPTAMPSQSPAMAIDEHGVDRAASRGRDARGRQ